MTTTTAQAVIHEPWCTDHVTLPEVSDPGDSPDGWCRRTFLDLSRGNGQDRAMVLLEDDGGNIILDVHVRLDAPGQRLSVTEAREMAAALLRAADAMEALQAS